MSWFIRIVVLRVQDAWIKVFPFQSFYMRKAQRRLEHEANVNAAARQQQVAAAPAANQVAFHSFHSI